MNRSEKIQVCAEIRIPSLPNFLRYGDGESQIMDIADISDADLQRIGKTWTEELIEQARERRANRQTKG